MARPAQTPAASPTQPPATSPGTAPDTDRFAFTDAAPWVVDRDHLDWDVGLGVIRAALAREVPRLTAPKRIPPLGRLARVSGRLAWAVAPWLLRERRLSDSTRRIDGLSRRLREAAEDLGPTYIKLGQIISSGAGIFPDELVAQFSLLRDKVPAESFEVVREVVESDLGRPLEDVFATFDRKPLAAASIAQVHVATLHTGEEVVVKVQRPTIRTQVYRDLEVMAWLAPFLIGRIPVSALANPPALVELFTETITEELDFRLEAENMLDVAEAFAQLDQRGFVVARPHPTLVTRRVLVMERLSGYGWEDIDGMIAAGISGHDVVRTGMVGFTEGAMVQGIFHGDLHGGNLFVLEDGRIALLDFGITARMTEKERLAFLRMMITGATGDIRGQLAAFRDLGALPDDVDLDWVMSELRLDGDVIDPTQLSQDEMMAELQRITKALLGMGARLPKILMLYVKNLVFLDGAIATLAPDLDIMAEIMNLWMSMAGRHGEVLAAQLGIAADDMIGVDETSVRAAFGITEQDASPLTHEELRRRRDLIRARMRKR
ncbi:MAG: AarF/ABC1/UbiB kinase family protein [Candidatus Microthrix sp.]|jgi:ubiquinone biosynthesis protein|uniref:ABC1 kinase family protein n=1 Tax=Candidatus Neomicrothrix sp. TaxID=2719034 RepID=UPI001B69F3CA|nr:AarF/UbiB family protein [Candidatus Microthrix sp.]MBP7405970.1 AarF/ABC1/UbiB kinase family protein [Candidatus Microthrix sp.]MBP7988482.1 AarF/ABC1/UbiB kinase family protein [Candidatus Microthrix sp.]